MRDEYCSDNWSPASLRKLLGGAAVAIVAILMLAAWLFSPGPTHAANTAGSQVGSASPWQVAALTKPRPNQPRPGPPNWPSPPAASPTQAPAPNPRPVINNPWPGDNPRAGDSRTCTASHYGGWDDPDAGTHTASGEKLDAEAMTAAHRTLPFNSRVLVRNLANGRTVTVRINDSGPNVALTIRCIDLTRGAFSALVGSGNGAIPGLIRVQITVLQEGVAANGKPNPYRIPPWKVPM